MILRMSILTSVSTLFAMVSSYGVCSKHFGLDVSCNMCIDGLLDWREIQTLVRSMPDIHKTLILANVKVDNDGNKMVEELAMATEHAPFRHRPQMAEIGAQRKKPKN